MNDMGVGESGDEPYRDDAYCETLALLADALLVLNQLVDERLKQNSLKKLKKNPQPLNILVDPPDAWQLPPRTPAFELPASASTPAQAAWIQRIFKSLLEMQNKTN